MMYFNDFCSFFVKPIELAFCASLYFWRNNSFVVVSCNYCVVMILTREPKFVMEKLHLRLADYAKCYFRLFFAQCDLFSSHRE